MSGEKTFITTLPFRHGLSHTIMCNVNDRDFYPTLSKYGEYAESEVSVIRQLVKPYDLVLDIGANIGLLTIPMSEFAARGTVIAFEPQRLPFQCLCGNLALNSVINVDARNLAVGSGFARIAVPTLDPHIPHSSGQVSVDSYLGQGDPVGMINIDALELPACDFMKIDIEGGEYEALHGSIKTIEKFHPAIFLEFHWNREPVARLLKSLGYRLWRYEAPSFSEHNYNGARMADGWGQIVMQMVVAQHPARPLVDVLTKGGLEEI